MLIVYIEYAIMALLGYSVATDVFKSKIYNYVNSLLLVVTLIGAYDRLGDYLIALGISIVAIGGLYMLGFFGGGDAKMLMILGGYAGLGGMLPLFATIFICGGLQALIYKFILRKKTIPYAIAIFVGFFLYWQLT